MARSIKKGPFVDKHLAKKVRTRIKAATRRRSIKTWSRRSHHPPGVRRPHLRGAQRPEVRSGVRHREHGGPQAGRVLADAGPSTATRPTRRQGRPESKERRRGQDVSAPTMRIARRTSATLRHGAAQGPAGRGPGPRQAGRGGARHPASSPKAAAAEPMAKLIQSAVANAEPTSKGQVDVDALYVKTHHRSTRAPTLQRFMPRAMGRATRIDKRTSHVHVVLGEAPKRRGRRGAYVGQKVHPIGFRLGVIKTWDSKWYRGEELRPVAPRGHPHPRVRKKKLGHAGISRSRSSAPPTR